MTEPRQRICRLADEAADAATPEAALEKVRELHDELGAYERTRVAEALREGCSFGGIAKALGVSRQTAHRRYRDLAPKTRRLPLSGPARRALHLAAQEARATGARCLTSDYLLLGVLRAGGGASQALEARGITASATRRCMCGNGATTNGSAGEQEGVAGAVLSDAAEIARARCEQYVDTDHIVLAAINGPDGAALRAITAMGVAPVDLRERLTSAHAPVSRPRVPPT